MGDYQNKLGGQQRYDRTGAADVTTLLAMFRDDFNGSAINPDNFGIVLGAGHSAVVAGGELTINTGTTINTETVLTGTLPFSVPFRVWFIARLSQRIVNQEFYLEVVDATGTMIARHLLDGTTATSGKYDTFNGGNSNGVQTSTGYQSSATDSIFEIQMFPDECWFFSRAVDSEAGRGINKPKTRNIPDPNLDYFIRVRAKNLGVAPASSTALTLGAICAQDINELTAEITGGQGSNSAAQAIAVQLVNNVTGTFTGNALGTNYQDTTTVLAAAGVFTGTSRDFGVSPQTGKKTFYAAAFADQAGTLYIDMSNDGATWRQAKKVPVAAGDSGELSVAVATRYYRVRYINGATLQAAFMINSVLQGF